MNCLFEETQKFTQWWLWVVLGLSFLLPITPDINNTPFSYFLVMIITVVFVNSMKLRICVNSKGLNYQFFPFHFKKKHIKTEDIKYVESLKYSPIMDYGGWGIRYRFKGKCYNVKGNYGVKVFLKNGSNILFGSQKHKELEASLKQVISQ